VTASKSALASPAGRLTKNKAATMKAKTTTEYNMILIQLIEDDEDGLGIKLPKGNDSRFFFSRCTQFRAAKP
jgi:hypothetical protein